MKGYVLDTSVLYYGKDLPVGYELIISPGVARELEKEDMGDRLQLLLASRVRVYSPSSRALERVKREGRATGDARRLSETDLEILALALDLGYELLTDDYTIQNLAKVLGVPCRSVDQKGIESTREWEARCTGCGKVFPPNVEECDVCGRPTKIRKKKHTR
jgi:UPF0271 protein